MYNVMCEIKPAKLNDVEAHNSVYISYMCVSLCWDEETDTKKNTDDRKQTVNERNPLDVEKAVKK